MDELHATTNPLLCGPHTNRLICVKFTGLEYRLPVHYPNGHLERCSIRGDPWCVNWSRDCQAAVRGRQRVAARWPGGLARGGCRSPRASYVRRDLRY